MGLHRCTRVLCWWIVSACPSLSASAATPGDPSSMARYAESYAKQGFSGPILAWSPEETADVLKLFNRLEAERETGRFPGQAHNMHLSNAEVWYWVSHPALTAATERVAGLRPGELHIFASTFVTKYPSADVLAESNNTRFGWHQDVMYWDLSPPVSLTSWIAIDRVSEESGCVRFQPGRHNGVAHEHAYMPEADNMLLSKKEIANMTGTDQAVCMRLEPGEMSVHDGWTPHASGPNLSAHRRAGLVINYMLANATLQPSQEGYGPLEDGALIEEFRIPVDPSDSFPPRVLQSPPVHEKWRRPPPALLPTTNKSICTQGFVKGEVQQLC